MPFNDAYKLLFVHIPKTGGQSVHEIFSMSMFPSIEGYEDAHLQAKTIQRYHLSKFQKYFKFTIVRHPLDRLVSEYFFSKKYRPYLPNTESISFSEFVQKISEINIKRKIHHLVNHLYPQSKFIFNRKNILVDYVGRFENFNESIKTIAAKVGFPNPDIIHKNKSQHTNFMDYYDPHTENLARKMYAEDFNRLGY